MRKAKWLAVCAGMLMATAVMAKPPELPAPAQGDGRVPVYPDGERYREPGPVAPPAPKPTTREIRPAVDWSILGEWWLLHRPLLLPPRDL